MSEAGSIAKSKGRPAEEVAKIEEDTKTFPNNAAKWYKKEILPKLKDYEWYRGEKDENLEGM